MKTTRDNRETPAGPWDEEHVKALLNFPRFPIRLIQQEPWQSWITERGGLEAVYNYLRNYPLFPSQRQILEVVLSNPEAVAEVYADRLNISRATYFYRLRELLPALVHALNHWQLTPPREHLSPPETVTLPPTVPTPLTNLVGAEPVLQTLEALLLREDVRLLTLLGPAGIGKTRLGIELARRVCDRFENALYFVDLSPLRDPRFVAPTIARVLGLGETSEACLKAHLKPQRLLLVLDNFEHLLSASSLVAELLASAPRLKILVTSRAALRIYGEHEFTIPPLATPTVEDVQDLQQLAQSPAVTLFVQRAQALNPGFDLNHENAEAVFELCRRMEGIPLIIEMAAYQMKYFSPQAMLVRLSSTKLLHFLSHGPKRFPHKQTLRDILDWSYRLLSPELRTLFARLAIFTGGCTIEAATAICSSPTAGKIESQALESQEAGAAVPHPVQAGLMALVDQSLLHQQVGPDGEPRFQMLGITREYALEQLALRGEAAALERAHALYYLGLARQSAPGQDAGLWRSWAESLQREYPNLRAAIQWAIDHREGELGLHFVAALWDFWEHCGYQHEARQITRMVLEQTADVRQPVRAQVLRLAGWLAHDLRDYTTMLWAFQTSLELSEALGDARDVGLAHQGLGALAQLRGQWEQACEHIQQCMTLFAALDDRKQIAWSLDLLGRIEFSQGNLVEAQARFQESLGMFRSLDANSAATLALCHLGQTLLYQGLMEQAAPVLEECLAMSRVPGATRSHVVAITQSCLAELTVRRGEPARARELIDACLTLGRDMGYGWCVERGCYAAGLLATQEHEYASAAKCFRESLLFQQSLKEYWRALALLEAVATLLIARNEWLGAARLYGAVAHLRHVLGVMQLPIDRPQYAQGLAQLREQLDAATLDEAWVAGQTLSLDQAMTYALRCLE